MSKSLIKQPFFGASNAAIGKMIAQGLSDAHKVEKAGKALPAVKAMRRDVLEVEKSGSMIDVSNSALGAYVKQSIEIKDMLRKMRAGKPAGPAAKL